jgi:hypothetical protein
MPASRDRSSGRPPSGPSVSVVRPQPAPTTEATHNAAHGTHARQAVVGHRGTRAESAAHSMRRSEDAKTDEEAELIPPIVPRRMALVTSAGPAWWRRSPQRLRGSRG